MNNKTIIHLRFGGLSPVTTAAANADWFAAPKSRSAVLKSSLTTVDGLPKTLKIFRIAGSRYWQIRIYSYGRYVMRSLKTVDAEQAKTLAKKFYADLLDTGRVDAWAQAHQQKLTYCPVANQMGLHDLIQEVIQAEREKLARHDITAGTFAMTKGRLEGLIFDFFCTRPIARIDTETIEVFVNQLTAKGLTTRTIQGYLAYLKKLLRLMFRKKVIMHFPLFPHIKANSVSRGAFTLTEYKANFAQGACASKLRVCA